MCVPFFVTENILYILSGVSLFSDVFDFLTVASGRYSVNMVLGCSVDTVIRRYVHILIYIYICVCVCIHIYIYHLVMTFTVRHGKIHPFLRMVNHRFLWAIEKPWRTVSVNHPRGAAPIMGVEAVKTHDSTTYQHTITLCYVTLHYVTLRYIHIYIYIYMTLLHSYSCIHK